MDLELNNYRPTPESIASGMMVEENGRADFTEAGLFALAGGMAYLPDLEPEDREQCLSSVLNVLRAARSGGLPADVGPVVLQAFSYDINPSDGSPGGVALSNLCRLVAQCVGAGRMSTLLQGNKAH